MGPEIVTVVAGGARWSAFTRVEVSASFEHATRDFKLDLAAEPGPFATAWTFKAGTEIDILFNADLVFRGFVDRYQPKLHEHKHAEICVSGRSKGQDFVDSSAMHETGEFRDKKPDEIGQALDKFGVGISSDVPLDKVEVARVAPGETAFRCVEKLCRQQGVFMVGQPDGSIKITKGGRERHAGGIIEGLNLKSGDADFNWSNRHSHIHVRGQRPHGTTETQHMRIDEQSQDEALQRYRPLVIAHDGDIDKERAKKRAKHRRDREAGNALHANVVVQGFRDDGGKLWTPGALVWLESPFLNVAQDMAIKSVHFTQSRGEHHGGSVSHLTLCDPRALGGKKAGTGKAGDAWDTDAGEDD